MVGYRAKKKVKEPFEPPEKQETDRHAIMTLLQERELTAREISAEVGIMEKDVIFHLEHIRRMVHGSECLLITPATCRKCGFTFSKRGRLTKPGKCPVCRCQRIAEPRFSLG